MAQLLRPCVDCGELSDAARCEAHRPARVEHTETAAARGYDYQWRKLSQRARKAQPFCGVCGTTRDLTVDHTPEAWERKAAGLAVRLEDVAVLCRAHNSSAGAARGDRRRG